MINITDNNVDIQNRIIYLEGDVDERLAATVAKALATLNAINRKPITVYINSIGGSVYDGLGIYDLLKASKSPIITIGYGSVMSIASLIFLAGSVRKLYKHTTYMIHELSDRVEGKFSDVQISVAEAQRLHNIMLKLYKATIDTKQLSLDNLSSDLFLTSQQCLKYKIATSIIK